MHTKKFITSAVSMLLLSSMAHAGPITGQGTWESTLQARDINGDGTVDAYYDTALNITWLADWNAAAGSSFDNIGLNGGTTTDGKITWDNAIAWAAGLDLYGVTGWRLPTVTDIPPTGCDFSFGGTDCGYNVVTSSSELAHMYYVTLGNLADYDTSGAVQSGSGLTNTADFLNMQASVYWFGTPYAPTAATNAWYFITNAGYQRNDDKDYGLYAVAVHPGDVPVAQVPEPSTIALLGLGLVGFGFARKRKRKG